MYPSAKLGTIIGEKRHATGTGALVADSELPILTLRVGYSG